uniref:Phospholipid scramblase n=2 Tax=Macrostomum lignano TaxID=282301 RepID=A0A1I8GZG8_9PLAT
MDVLASLDRILIKQKKELLEVVSSFETNNQYEIREPNGRPFLTAQEDTSCCSRQFCGKDRPFVINIFDYQGVPQIRITREYKVNCFCQGCSCCSCCKDRIQVECPVDRCVGFVTQECAFCSISYGVFDAQHECSFHIKGPSYCMCTCPCSDKVFSLQTPDRSTEVGQLKKVWGGLLTEMMTDADSFELLVPAQMPVDQKAVLLGAAFLIDFMFFEDNAGKSKNDFHSSYRILIRQKIELLEIITSIETNNRYAICDSNGQPVLMAEEDSSCCSRQCCRNDRPFVFNIIDLRGMPQIRVARHYTYNWCQCCSCLGCCQDSIDVECPPGHPIGYVIQNGACCNISFNVYDANLQPVMFLRGPNYCLCTCPGTVHTFSVMTADQTVELGKLRKTWGGLLKELLTDADNFELLVPPEMPDHHKGLLIGATLLIDFMFFEDNDAKSNGMRIF